ncbi:NADPH-dependent FMN reductase [Pallidibacillus pasinlerensis]|uniref:NAD(P)H-dependent oxidoreductase n=1 Tax=Pallidibacillus pasinlerensis TaxID=2703818 RepID=A0ABX0A8C6_9BACI|nr:NAD(P)H-dependent oxidoreductase [Pallidibacillus pasinlerensis]NCU17377.1 NAD(P)H-dependent oxidoreductase [Pallidibacillus pasinlerensis]
MKLVGISGALAGSKTAHMVAQVLHAAKFLNPHIETELIDLKDYDIEFMRGYALYTYNEDTVTVVNKILKADCIVIGTPIYQASISGSLKNLLDHLPEYAFDKKIVSFITTAGSEKYFLVGEYHLRPIIQFFGGILPSRNVFVPDDSFNDESEIVDKLILKRIEGMAKEILDLSGKKE